MSLLFDHVTLRTLMSPWISCFKFFVKIQQISQETNALTVVDMLADFLYLYKKQANQSTGNLTTNRLFFKFFYEY